MKNIKIQLQKIFNNKNFLLALLIIFILISSSLIFGIITINLNFDYNNSLFYDLTYLPQHYFIINELTTVNKLYEITWYFLEDSVYSGIPYYTDLLFSNTIPTLINKFILYHSLLLGFGLFISLIFTAFIFTKYIKIINNYKFNNFKNFINNKWFSLINGLLFCLLSLILIILLILYNVKNTTLNNNVKDYVFYEAGFDSALYDIKIHKDNYSTPDYVITYFEKFIIPDFVNKIVKYNSLLISLSFIITLPIGSILLFKFFKNFKIIQKA